MLLQTDTRRRITLPPNSGIKPGDALDLEILEDGRIMLVPVEAIPKHQLWAWTAESKHLIEASMSDPRQSIVVETSEQAEDIAKRWVDEG
jgi:bifunctional DNA-binding transcriptional regulator/antitoxin component of YhaV-PrlF toxin-antitoxin module